MNPCRVCGNHALEVYLDLGQTPLANAYLTPEEFAHEQWFELAVAFCPECYLSQLTAVVPPELMFEHYLYVSSTTWTFRQHCENLATSVVERLRVHKPEMLALDIGSNDGCLLSCFARLGFRVVGIDPARNLAAEAIARGIDTITAYWGSDSVVDTILRTRGPASVVTATNVLAHVDNTHAFVDTVARVMSPEGLFVFEVPYLVDLIEKCEFDTIYHEHLSYFLLAPLRRVLEAHDLQIVDAVHQSIHGGTLRVYVAKRGSGYPISETVGAFLQAEEAKGFHTLSLYRQFSEQVERNKEMTRILLSEIKSKNLRIAGYGASAKGNTLLNYYQIDSSSIDYIVDDNPKKHGYYTPGSHIPIMAPTQLSIDRPDYLFLLAWNFAEEIFHRTSDYRRAGGQYIIPVPEVVVVNEWSRENTP